MDEKLLEFFESVPDDILGRLQFSMPWQYDRIEGGKKDPDGFERHPYQGKEDDKSTRESLQLECWDKLHRNPHVNTTVRGHMGRLTGMYYNTSSGIWDIQQVIEETELDPRNRLYNFWPKYVARANVEGELHLMLTLHEDGFVEVDFIDPAVICDKGDDDSGIIFHPSKCTMPLFYNISKDGEITSQVPSIFVARYPELIFTVNKHDDYDRKLQQSSRSRKKKFRVFGGYRRFIVSWDKGFITKRAISYLRTTIEWLNHYENLKKYEIDHKKSSGAYLWIFRFTDVKSFRVWLSLSDEERRKTGIMAKKTPGSTLVVPPGMEVSAENPNLSAIKDQDTDILHMISSGLNEPEDVLSGASKGTYASVKASRGPMSDRTSDEIAYFDRFQKHDFWSAIFFLRSSVTKFPKTFKVKKAIGWNEKQEPKFQQVERRPEQLIDINYPQSEVTDFEGRAKGLLGSKHGPLSETLGIPSSEVAKRLGFGDYNRLRLDKATEDELYPKLIYIEVAESIQEQAEAERNQKAQADSQKKESNEKE